MAYITVYSSPFVEVTRQDDGFYIQSFKKGLSYDEFIKIISEYPDIYITNFFAVKDALVFAPRDAQKFAKIKEKVKIVVTDDGLKVFVTLSMSENDIGTDVIKEIIWKLNQLGVVYGIKKELLLNLHANQPILIAEGLSPDPGKDSIIKLYQLKEVKPDIKEDGKADHYELNLINMVQKGDWLGEKINATDGIDGINVFGKVIKTTKGNNFPLQYDKPTVTEIVEGNKSTLYALRTGAVYFEGDRIGVSNHLEIKGDIGVKTGNVDFDGYLTVKGTIEDNYSVATSKDIEILGEYGVGSVKEISSREGSIYIRGGIAGRGKTIIKCNKNLYLKYAADTDIYCDGSVHIGFYCLNSNITAKEVILESMKGQIIGGNINAEIKVVASIYGSSSEKRTNIVVKGFDRNALKATFDDFSERIETLKTEINQLKQQIMLGQAVKAEADKLFDKYNDLRAEVQELEEKKKNIAGYLKAKGEGEVTILKKAFPNTMIEIRKRQIDVYKPLLRVSYYYSDGMIKEM